MEVKVTLDTGGVSLPGVDKSSLEKDVEAEVKDFATRSDAQGVKRQNIPPPKGAQGEDQLVQWLIEVAKEPAMIKVYLRALIFALNELASTVSRVSQEPSKHTSNPKNEEKSLAMRVSVLGKDIVLPVATTVVKKFLEETVGPPND